MSPATIIEAIGTFTVTNIDDIVVLAVFFGQAPAHRGAAIRVIAGQYLGFAAILAVSIAGAMLGATLLPSAVLPYFGLLLIMLGLRAAWVTWRHNRDTAPSHAEDAAPPSVPGHLAGRGRHFRQRRRQHRRLRTDLRRRHRLNHRHLR